MSQRMRPEGRNNAPIVLLKALVFIYVGVMLAAVLPLSAVYSLWFGRSFGHTFRFVHTQWYLFIFLFLMAASIARSARVVSAEAKLADRDTFVSQASEALISVQCRPVSAEEDTLTFRAGILRRLFYDALYIHLQDGSARIVGPMYYVGVLLKAVGAGAPNTDN